MSSSRPPSRHSITNARSGRRDGGFTLIEAIACMVILGTMASVSAGLVLRASDAYTRGATSAQLVAELSTGMDRIDRELRRIERKGAGAVAPNIASVSATSITWSTNWSLTLSSGHVLFSEAGSTPVVLLRDVTAFTVAAFNESDAALVLPLSGSGCDPIRRLSVSVTLSRNGQTESLRTKVFLRSTLAGIEP